MTGKLIGPQIAAELDGAWHVDPTWPDDYNGVKLAGPGGMRLWVRDAMYSDHKPPGTVAISRDFQETQYSFEGGDEPQMFANPNRGAATIAKEVTRKLIPGFADLMVKVRAKDARHAAARGKRETFAARVYEAIGGRTDLTPRPGSREDRDRLKATHTDVNLFGLFGGYGDMWISFEADRVNLKLSGIPSEVALAMLEAGMKAAEAPKCETCGGALEPSAYGGHVHADDANDTHRPAYSPDTA